MTESDDSRPFTVFRENLEHFKSMLDADVSHCLDTLDPKVLELVGNWHTSSSRPLNAQMEISKAKQDINCFMKDMINEIGEQWMQHLIQIRDNLVENVESFLAGIQLEPSPAPMNPVTKPAKTPPPKTNDPATAPPPHNWGYPPQGVSTASQMPNQQQPQHPPQQQPYTTYPAYQYPNPVAPNAYNPYEQIGLPPFQPVNPVPNPARPPKTNDPATASPHNCGYPTQGVNTTSLMPNQQPPQHPPQQQPEHPPREQPQHPPQQLQYTPYPENQYDYPVIPKAYNSCVQIEMPPFQPVNPVPKPARPPPPKTNDPATAPPPHNWGYPPQGVSTASQMPNQQQPQHPPQQQPYTTYPAYQYPNPVAPNAYNPYGQIGLPQFQPVEAPTPVPKRRKRPPANSSATNAPTSSRKTIDDSNNNIKKRKRVPVQLVEKKRPFGEGTSKMHEEGKGDCWEDFHFMEEEFEKKTDYKTLVALNDVRLVGNVEAFECPVCFLDVAAGDGAVLQDCLHGFCKECLASSVEYSDTAMVKCPFRNDEYSCESHLRDREIKCLVTPDIYEKHLQRSMALAESQAQNSFHCKTPDCRGWCLFEDDVNIFRCPVCEHTNCLTCAAIHEGKNCRQYQDAVDFNSDTSKEAKKTRQYLQSMLQKGEAMQCPQCQVILMKKEGCDWFMCSMCKTEVCWVTKGPRWGPKGKGDTSGGCKCMVKGKKCHPKCGNCH